MSDNAFPDALPPQYRLHWYVIERVLGQGGFGITYLARDTNLDQQVAIKEYLPVEVATRRADATVGSRTDEQQERYRWGLDRFIREARTLARFDHPNIVRVLSVFELNSTAYMVMRFEEGETLAALLEQRHSLGEADLLRVLLPILDGLELVHNAGFIHRDIKPDNILIRSDGTSVLLDFGSARYAAGLSRTVTILVAPGYAPFEQYYSSGENQGPWTDIYSLGATCYRAIAGRAPLDAIARSKGILGSTQELLVPATAVGSGRYSERLLKAIDHALAFSEKERPQTLAAWRTELVGAARAPERSVPLTRSRPPAEVAPATELALPPPRPAWAGARAPLVWGGAGAVAALIAITFVPWLASGRRDTPPPVAIAPPAPPVERPAEKPPLDDEKLKSLIQKQIEDQRRQEAQKEEQRRPEAQKHERPKPQEKSTAQAKARPQPVVPKTQPTPSVPPVAQAQPIPTVPPVAESRLDRVPEGASAKAEPPAPPPPAPAPPPATPKVATTVEQLASAGAAIEREDYKEALRILRPLAASGNARALVRLGDLYLDGRGVEQSDKEALGHYVRAGRSCDTEGQLRAGDMYAQGRGVPVNNMLAYAYYSAAAHTGLIAAKLYRDRVGKLLQAAEAAQADKLSETLACRKGS